MPKSKVNSYDESTKTAICTTVDEWVNVSTGERANFAQITKRIYGQKNFWKVYLMDFLAILGIMDSRQLDVFCYVCENTHQGDNLFIGTQRQVAEAIGCSTKTVNIIFKKLISASFMTKVNISVYRINPDVLVRGNESKKQILLSYYREEEKNSKPLIEMQADPQLKFNNEGEVVEHFEPKKKSKPKRLK